MKEKNRKKESNIKEFKFCFLKKMIERATYLFSKKTSYF